MTDKRFGKWSPERRAAHSERMRQWSADRGHVGKESRAILALRNVRALAMRLRRTDPASAGHLLRFCAEAGVVGSVLRGAP